MGTAHGCPLLDAGERGDVVAISGDRIQRQEVEPDDIAEAAVASDEDLVARRDAQALGDLVISKAPNHPKPEHTPLQGAEVLEPGLDFSAA
jgi:hypothetical protein